MSKPIYYLITTELASIIDQTLSGLVEETKVKDVKKQLLVHSYQIRPYMLNMEAVIKTWGEVRKGGEELVDVVLGSTAQFSLLLAANGASMEDLATAMATAYSDAMYKAKGDEKKIYSAIDDPISERSSTLEDLTGIFKHNPWLVLLIAITYIKKEELMGSRGKQNG